MATSKGKTNAKKAASKKTAAKKAPAKKPITKAQPPVKDVKPAKTKAPKKAKPFVVRKNDIVMAMGKFFRVESVSKKAGTLVGTHLHMVECRMTGVHHRTIAIDLVTGVWLKSSGEIK